MDRRPEDYSGLSIGLLAILASLLLSASCSISAQPVVPADFGSSVRLISAERSRCEAAVELLVLLSPTTRVMNHWDLARTSYTEAQIAFNAWLDRLKFAIDNGEDLSERMAQEDYRTSLKEAADKSAAFRSLVNVLQSGGLPPSVPIAAALLPSAADVLVGLSKAGLEIYTELQKQRSEERRAAREQVKRALDGQKFKSFINLTKGVQPA